MAIYGLFIGDDYRGFDYELPDCELDAARVGERFAPYCRAAITLLGPQATPRGIRQAASRVKSRLRNGDHWIVSNSGHGTREFKDGRWVEAIVCHGGELLYDFEMHALFDDERAPESLLTVFSDSCFSGGMARSFNDRIARSIGVQHCRSHVATPIDLPHLPKIFFSGSTAREESYSTGDGGALTNAILQALDEQGFGTTYGKLFQRVGGRKGALLPTGDWPQHPQCLATDKRLLKLRLSSFYHPTK